jgi:hypothetical protein
MLLVANQMFLFTQTRTGQILIYQLQTFGQQSADAVYNAYHAAANGGDPKLGLWILAIGPQNALFPIVTVAAYKRAADWVSQHPDQVAAAAVVAANPAVASVILIKKTKETLKIPDVQIGPRLPNLPIKIPGL